MPNDPEMFAAFNRACEEPAAWHPDDSGLASNTPHEPSRVFAWLMWLALAALVYAAVLNVKGCEGQQQTVKNND